MIGTMSKREVYERFLKGDSRITVIFFDPETMRRSLTFGPSNIFHVMEEIARRARLAPVLVKLYYNLPPNYGLERHYYEYDSSKYYPYEMYQPKKA